MKKRIEHIRFTVSDFNGKKEIKGVDMQIITILIWDFDEFFYSMKICKRKQLETITIWQLHYSWK
jgi:hypothetical protein